MMLSWRQPLDTSLALAWNQTKLRPTFMMGPATIEGPGGWDRGPRANALALMLNVGCQSQCESAPTHHVADSEAGNVTAVSRWEAPFKLPHTGSYHWQPPGTGGLCIKRKCQRRGWFQGKRHRAPERKVRSHWQMAAP